MSPRPDNSAYTIGWICALPIELAACLAAFDQEFTPEDYEFGRIYGRDVVAACLPRMGTNSAAVVAAEMYNKFPNIKALLMVGIGGGVPSPENDVRLGDIVVSKPTGQHGGVVQYDMGKTLAGGTRLRTGHLNSPSPMLLKVVNRLIANSSLDQQARQDAKDISTHLQSILTNPKFAKPAPASDILFLPSNVHPSSQLTCSNCDRRQTVHRVIRSSQEPRVHYGNIASGNQVMRDAITRDEISASLGGILCFEMEAAGLMNDFSCLVIRGICDYSDSHKNKEWQPYAAATAAAFAKKLISSLPVVVHEQWAKMLASLKFNQMDSRLHSIPDRHKNTCTWLIDSPQFRRWIRDTPTQGHSNFLWVKGNPGSGKSTLMKFTLEHLKANMPDITLISFFFNARGAVMEKTVQGVYQSLLYQILSGFDVSDTLSLLQGLGDIENTEILSTREWTASLLQGILRTVILQAVRPLIILIDALDECLDEEVQDMVDYLEEILRDAQSAKMNIKVLFASRYYPSIAGPAHTDLPLDSQNGHSQDIIQYVTSKLQRSNGNSREELKGEIVRRSQGNFMWVVLVIAMLRRAEARGRVHTFRQTLEKLPVGLDSLFASILTRDTGDIDEAEEMRVCLTCVLFATRPLRVSELYDAICTGTRSVASHEVVSVQTAMRFIMNASRGLLGFRSGSSDLLIDPEIQFIHETVREFLLSQTKLWWTDSQQLPFGTIGHGNEEMKKLCFKALHSLTEVSRSKVLRHVRIDGPNVVYGRPKAKENLDREDFAVYAASHIVWHANVALGADIKQDVFIKAFPPHDRDATCGTVGCETCRMGFLLDIAAQGDCPHMIKLALLAIPEDRPDCYRLSDAMNTVIQNRASAAAVEALLANSRVAHSSMAVKTTPFDFDKAARELVSYRLDPGHFSWGNVFVSASYGKNKNLLRVLMTSRAVDVNKPTRYFQPALIAAVRERQHELLQLLIAHPHIDVDVVDGEGRSAMWHALDGRNMYAVQLLLLSERYVADPYGTIARDLFLRAVLYSSSEEIEKLLFEGSWLKSLFDYRDDGYKPLNLSMRQQLNILAARYILEQVNQKDSDPSLRQFDYSTTALLQPDVWDARFEKLFLLNDLYPPDLTDSSHEATNHRYRLKRVYPLNIRHDLVIFHPRASTVQQQPLCLDTGQLIERQIPENSLVSGPRLTTVPNSVVIFYIEESPEK